MMPHENKTEKTKMLEEAKENSDLITFIKSLTKEEIQRVRDTRDYDEIKPHTPAWRVALYNDSIRSALRLKKSTIRKRILTIHDLTNNITRLKDQLESGKITEEIKTGIRMNEREVESLIRQNSWLRDGEVEAIPRTLAEMRGLVGHKDVARNIVMSKEEFDKYVQDIEDDVKSQFGYVIFGELER